MAKGEKPDFEVSAKTARAVDRLVKMKPGEEITWKELTRVIGEDAQTTGRHYVQQARKVMLRDHRRVYECVRNKGVRYLTKNDIAGRLGQHSIRRINRAASRGMRKQEVVQSHDGLTASEIARHQASLHLLGYLVAESTHHKRAAEERREMAKIPQQDARTFDGC